ncbi:hypothetical protein ACFOEE_10525 [Pseudoalteromonas fenneropenaei]|uniref:BIG2 domain-containing protein n=1 Tax=Pseudoalteromonas fenneropenaei TaxID=1737459 RepID=A0ABV7CKA1_9GAMM
MTIFRPLLSVSIFTSALLVAGCGGNDNAEKIIDAFDLQSQIDKGTVVVEFNIAGGDIRIKPGQTAQLTATGVDKNGNQRDITKELKWLSLSPEVASINAEGKVTALKNSDAVQSLITFEATTLTGLKRTVQLSVSDLAPQTLSLATTNADIAACVPSQVSATAHYADGYVSALTTSSLSWQSLTPEILTTSSTGKITGLQSQTQGTIKATYGAVAAQLNVAISNTTLSRLAIANSRGEELSELDLQLGKRSTLVAYGVAANGDKLPLTDYLPWSVDDQTRTHLTDTNTGKVVWAVKTGDGKVTTQCDVLQASVTVDQLGAGSGNASKLSLTDNLQTLTLKAGESTSLKVYATVSGLTALLNVSELANWSWDSSKLELTRKNIGSDEATIEIKAKTGSSGTTQGQFSYDGQSVTLNVTIN